MRMWRENPSEGVKWKCGNRLEEKQSEIEIDYEENNDILEINLECNLMRELSAKVHMDQKDGKKV